MSSASGSDAEGGKAPGRSSAARSTSSTARRIAVSLYVRRFFSFVLFDIVLVAVLAGAFWYRCAEQMPDGVRTGRYLSAENVRLQPAEDAGRDGSVPLGDWELVLVDGEGAERSFSLSEPLAYAVPVGCAVLVAQVGSLLGAPSHTRLIRRKLKPLNDLALAAEAIGSAAAERPSGDGGRAKFESLERAIATASVDAPAVVTGDKDLRSIEVALNSLLRRMQEAKLQQMRFVSDASHELRTPIAVIQGYVGMLDRWGKTDEAVLDESIAALKSESEHMKELVEQLLFLARGDSGRTTLEREEFDLAALVEEAAAESRMIDAEHVYEADGTAVPRRMVGDRAMVKQSMRIMLQNAARYSAGGTTVRLGAVGDPGRGRVGFTVQDEGIGMAEEDAAHVFERFYRSDVARDRQAGGTGLGLAIAKWIVDAHAGSIEVLSHEGVGTRFTVWFPQENG